LEHWEAKGFQKEEEFARAIALALFDYLEISFVGLGNITFGWSRLFGYYRSVLFGD
jgi:hypothetical protein